MDQKKKNLYNLIFKVALNYRLSLKNICMLLGKEPTEENKQEIYDIFELLYGDNLNLRSYYVFLFDYETRSEPEFISNSALNLATLFFIKYKTASKSGDIETTKKLREQLDSLDKKIKLLRFRDKEKQLTDDDYITIITYRIKYSLSKDNICSYLDINRDTLRVHENKLENSKLKYKIDILNDYCLDHRNKKGM